MKRKLNLTLNATSPRRKKPLAFNDENRVNVIRLRDFLGHEGDIRLMHRRGERGTFGEIFTVGDDRILKVVKANPGHYRYMRVSHADTIEGLLRPRTVPRMTNFPANNAGMRDADTVLQYFVKPLMEVAAQRIAANRNLAPSVHLYGVISPGGGARPFFYILMDRVGGANAHRHYVAPTAMMSELGNNIPARRRLVAAVRNAFEKLRRANGNAVNPGRSVQHGNVKNNHVFVRRTHNKDARRGREFYVKFLNFGEANVVNGPGHSNFKVLTYLNNLNLLATQGRNSRLSVRNS